MPPHAPCPYCPPPPAYRRRGRGRATGRGPGGTSPGGNLRRVSASTRLQLRVAPGASRPGVVGRHGTAWKVRVAAAPEAGKANDAVVSLLAHTLALPARNIKIVSGHSSRDKIVELVGIEAGEISIAEIERRLARASDPGKDTE
ncbi:MAG: DUF167 domain-containing protein [Actinomycetota bacterium]|nr:DUF167 domain-containing protein [Actinomycetota bacterium]